MAPAAEEAWTGGGADQGLAEIQNSLLSQFVSDLSAEVDIKAGGQKYGKVRVGSNKPFVISRL